MGSKVRVWDLPTRVFHWSLVLCFIGLLVTGEVGGDAMVWHFRLGYTVLSLLLFRLVWGFVGGYWSRFRSFVVSPWATLRYVQGHGAARQSVGHNPLGAWSVLALLAFSLLQVAAGLCSDDEIATAGPLAKWVSSSWVGYATYYHTKIGKVILIVLVQLHIAAIIFYRVRRQENGRSGLGLLLKHGHDFFFARNDLKFGGEVVLSIDPKPAFGQIFDVSQRGFDLVFAAEIFVDRLGFRRRFNDD